MLISFLTNFAGNMKNGAEDVKRHRWFKNIDWESMFSEESDVNTLWEKLEEELNHAKMKFIPS